MRTFGVEEELLLDAAIWEPLASGADVVRRHEQGLRRGPHHPAAVPPAVEPAEVVARHALTVELQQEEIEVVGPPLHTLGEQIAAIRTGRTVADETARTMSGRAVALATSVCPGLPHLVPPARYRRIQQHVGRLAAEQLTCGFHVHVAIAFREEGVAVLGRIRVWLPVLLALSANSPFWYGVDTGFASYQYQAPSRSPTAGASEIFGSVAEYDRQVRLLLESGVPLDDGMIYFDARLSARFPTVEVRIADVCLDPVHAGVLAALVRALVETAARAWHTGGPPAPVGITALRTWCWRAARSGVEGPLVDPATGAPAPAQQQEGEDVHAVVAAILGEGSGARAQREAYTVWRQWRDVVATALTRSTPDGGGPAGDAPG